MTSGLTVRCSTNRAHNPIYISNNFYLSCAPGGIRTRNGLSSTLLIKSQKRYQLRHGSVPLFYVCFRFRSGSQDQICFRFIILIITVWGRRDSNSHRLICMRRIYSPLIFPATNYPNYISMNLCFFFQHRNHLRDIVSTIKDRNYFSIYKLFLQENKKTSETFVWRFVCI